MFVMLLALCVGQSLSAREITEQAAIAAALARADLQALEASRRILAVADVEEAALLPNPRATTNREGFTTAGDRTIETSYELSQQLDLAGRRGLARDAAALRLSATDGETLGDRQAAIAEVRKSFGEALYRSRIVAALDDGLARLSTTSGIIEGLAQSGEASGYDRRRIQRELLGTRVRLATATAELGRSRATLAAYLDLPTGEGLQPTGSPLPPSPPALESLRAALHERPDLAALLARADAASEELQIAQRAWIPAMTVGIGNRVIEEARGDNDRVMLSLSMPLPVFDRGQPAAKRAVALREGFRAEHALRLARLDAALGGPWQQASRLHASALAFRREGLAQSRELTGIARTAHAAGEGGVLDLIDAYRSELDTELMSLDLDYRARVARIELDQIAGVSPHE
jgi:cobalt-zinc-cadmium efflux system outer membrane protein